MPRAPIAAAGLLACACVSAAQPAPRAFDAARAFEHLERVVAIGPRPAGSPGAAKARAYVKAQLQPLGLGVQEQPFQASTPLGPIPMVNLRATIEGSRPGPTLIVAGHYDTKRFDEGTFVGANDGGSSTAFLIELARVLGTRRQGLPIELLFLDGEEAVVAWAGLDNTYGSRYYVEAALKDGSLKRIGAMILVDMIAERTPRFLRESQSTPWLTDILWTQARRLGRREFVDDSTEVLDDHLPFLRAGVPAVNIIDLDYAWWHTPGDTVDKLSPQGLEAVASVLLAALPAIEQRVSGPR